ncbi:MAG: hypothetical protein ABJC55_09790, partial [Algoriphagus sp.]
MKQIFYCTMLLFFSWSCTPTDSSPIEIVIDPALEAELKDGRLLLIFSTDSTSEPRFGISDNVGTNQVFGMDFEDYEVGKPILFDPESFGYPVERMDKLEDGTYYVQAFIQKHDTFVRSDGHTVKLPMDQGEGRQWARAPKNIYSIPMTVNWKKGQELSLTVNTI